MNSSSNANDDADASTIQIDRQQLTLRTRRPEDLDTYLRERHVSHRLGLVARSPDLVDREPLIDLVQFQAAQLRQVQGQ